MAFALKTNNNLAVDSLYSPSGVLATSANFIDPYTYAIQYQPELVPELHLKHGKGKITKFCALTGSEKSYASDQVKHSEMGRLHTVSAGVDVAGDVFTSPAAHNLRVNDVIMISDGVVERNAIVSEITSTTVFVAENMETGAFGFANAGVGPVTVSAFSNSWGKGAENFTKGMTYSPEIITNYSHIIKEFYDTNESDMAHLTWIKAPQYPGGEGWYNIEMQRTMDLYDNKIEMTHLLNRRVVDGSAAALAGFPLGMKGVVQQVEERGNIGNEYLTDIEELSTIAFRIKQQGGARAYTVWCDHKQMAYFRVMLASVNGNFATGTNYGIFQNKKEMALALDFQSVTIDGVTFHFTPWSILDDPTLLGAAGFKDTSIACLFVPAGDTTVLEEGNSVSRAYLSIRYRQQGGLNRYKKTKIFGGAIGTAHKKDTMEAHYETEQTNQVIGANQYFVIRRGTGIYTGS